MSRISRIAVGVALVALVGAPASAHELDHPAPATSGDGPISTAFNAGGDGATWELVTTIVTGNPHSDLDYFTGSDGEMYLSAGTLGTGANGGGQTIVRLTDGGRPSEDGNLSPAFVAGHPSAACTSDPAAALGLQHDVEATPKGDVLLNTDWGEAVDRDARAQLLLDASDAEGRCHDGGTLGLSDAPQGGIEIVDVTDPANPVEIALTSHVGEAHTVNVDPSRPHIAYVVTSDAVNVSSGQRQNEVPGSSDRFDLDGFEMLDLSSCLTAPYGTMAEGLTTEEKRHACQPEVYRFRYPDLAWSLGHTNQGSVYGCHELEVHPDDTLTCGSGAALIALDMAGVFADTDGDGLDEIQGTPLPCSRRASTSAAPFGTGAAVVDCVVGEDADGNGVDLSVPAWLRDGAPSVEGVAYRGSIHHQGRETTTGALQPAFDATEDIDFDHEAELTHSGDFVLATDERGGGVSVGAQCSPGVDLAYANGGIHAYPVDALRDSEAVGVPDAETAQAAYAQTPDGQRAIARAPINTQPQGTECTAHVFHQIPGQNRIFMGWYSQGTQVFDYVEHADGTFSWHHVGWFTPEHANTWTSAVFDFWENEDGTWTYLGATGDFNVGNGRSAIDVYRVTLPAPRQFADGSTPHDPGEHPEEAGDRPECDDERPGQQPPHCDDDGRPADDRGGDGQDDAVADGRRGDDGDRRADGDEGRTRAAASDTRPASSPTTVIDLRPAASRTAPSSSPSVPASLSLLLGLGLLAIGVVRRRRTA